MFARKSAPICAKKVQSVGNLPPRNFPGEAKSSPGRMGTKRVERRFQIFRGTPPGFQNPPGGLKPKKFSKEAPLFSFVSEKPRFLPKVSPPKEIFPPGKPKKFPGEKLGKKI